MIRRLLVIGETAGRLSESFRASVPNIEWQEIKGMRNRLVHEYDDISIEMVWEIANTDVPNLIEVIRPMIPTEEEP